MATKPQPPSRLSDFQASPQTQAVHTDIYDKLNRIFASLETVVTPTPTPTPTPVVPVVPVTPSGGGGGGGSPATSKYANVPQLPLLPSNNPTTGAPYAVDGTLIEVNLQFWRYAGAPIYQWQQAGTATELLADTHANRVANFPATLYPKALFFETDTLLLLESNGTIWETTLSAIQDTHANRLTTWPSVQYSVGTQFYETDRTVTYVVENATGTVTVSGGTTVAWASGNHFINSGTGFNAAQWPAGTPIVINGVATTIAAVTTDIALTLQVAATNGTHSYSVASGRWVYLSGQCSMTQATIPADLGEADAGFLEIVSDYAHTIEWSGSAYGWGPVESGSGYFQDFAVAPTGTGWQVCDGSAGVKYLKADGTTGTVTVPNTASTAAYRKLGAAYTSAITAATVPTLLMASYTPAGSISTPTFSGGTFTPAGSVSSTFSGNSQAFGTTAVTAVGVVNAMTSPNPYTPSGAVSSTFTGAGGTPTGTVSTPTFTGVPAILTGTITLPADPVAHFQAIQYFRI